MNKPIAKALVSAKFQIVIPKKVKERLNVEEGDYIMFIEEDNEIHIKVGRIVNK